MDGGPILVVHLVELVSEAQSIASKHKISCLKSPLLGELTCASPGDLGTLLQTGRGPEPS